MLTDRTEGSANEKPVMARQLVAYIDLLGFSSIIGRANQADAAEILQLLREIQDQRAEFSAEQKTEGSTTSSWVTPAISAFSDHVVLSFELDHPAALSAGVWTCLVMLQRAAGRVAHRARSVGCLIRGAIVVDALYHAEGVVFGPALVRAYELESQLANTPRVVIHPSALKTLGGQLDANGTLYRDADGMWCLDYMRGDLMDVDDFHHGDRGQEGCSARKAWVLTLHKKAVDQALALEKSDNLRAATKWRSFASRFKTSMQGVNRHWFNTDGSPLLFPEDVL